MTLFKKKIKFKISWKLKRLYSSTLFPQNTQFLHSVKPDEYPLILEQSCYATKIVNTSIVYELNASPRNPFDNLTLKNCLFGATNIVKNSNEDKWFYSGYGINFVSQTKQKM